MKKGSQSTKMKVVISGYFDPIHIGHIEYFKLARKLADKHNAKLVVILNNDKQAVLKKGKPFMKASERKIILEAIKYIDEVFISIDKDESVCESLRAVKPDIFAKGGDRFNHEIPESKVCDELGIKMIDGLGKKIQSSSWLIKRE
jgi:cytidyltransferase-like protein